MKASRIFTVISCVLFVSSCASTQSIEKQAAMHDKASDYYESIGQPGVAVEEHNLAKQKRNEADDFGPMVVSFFELFRKKDKD